MISYIDLLSYLIAKIEMNYVSCSMDLIILIIYIAQISTTIAHSSHILIRISLYSMLTIIYYSYYFLIYLFYYFYYFIYYLYFYYYP